MQGRFGKIVVRPSEIPPDETIASRAGLARGVSAVIALTRWREWVQSKLLLAAGAAVLLAPAAPLGDVAAALATVALLAAFGYASNELAGKHSRATALGVRASTAFVVAAAGLALGSSTAWSKGASGPVAIVGGLVLAHAYSHRPLRLKERGRIGIVAAAAAQWMVPVLAVAALRVDGWHEPATWALALFGLAIGIRWMTIHQLHDRDADRRAQLRTYGASGRDLDPWLRGALSAEVALLVLVVVLAWPRSAVPLMAAVLWLALDLCWRRGRAALPARLRTYGGAPLAELYFLLLPLALTLERALASPSFVLLAFAIGGLGSDYVVRLAFPKQRAGDEAVRERARA
jgi:hypothetical protein